MDKTIEYILEVAHCGGIAKAARKLYITPSALSKYIILKEEELGVKIFNREGNRFTLTYPGERYVEMLREQRDAQEKMRLEMKRLADMYSGRLRIGFQMSLESVVIRRIIPALQDEYPSMRVSLEESTTPELRRMLRTNQLDVILTLTDGNEPDELLCDRICDSPVVVAAAKGSPLGRSAVEKQGFSHPWLDDASLLKEKLVLDQDARSLRRYAPTLLLQENRLLHSEVTVTNARAALMCVAQDLGVIILPELLVRSLRFEDEVELYSFGPEEIRSYLGVIYDRRSSLHYEIEGFRRIVSEFF